MGEQTNTTATDQILVEENETSTQQSNEQCIKKYGLRSNDITEQSNNKTYGLRSNNTAESPQDTSGAADHDEQVSIDDDDAEKDPADINASEDNSQTCYERASINDDLNSEDGGQTCNDEHVLDDTISADIIQHVDDAEQISITNNVLPNADDNTDNEKDDEKDGDTEDDEGNVGLLETLTQRTPAPIPIVETPQKPATPVITIVTPRKPAVAKRKPRKSVSKSVPKTKVTKAKNMKQGDLAALKASILTVHTAMSTLQKTVKEQQDQILVLNNNLDTCKCKTQMDDSKEKPPVNGKDDAATLRKEMTALQNQYTSD